MIFIRDLYCYPTVCLCVCVCIHSLNGAQQSKKVLWKCLNLDDRVSQAEKNLKMWKVHKYLPHSDQQQEILVASQRSHLRNHLTSEGTLV